jgi:hypothetical protein
VTLKPDTEHGKQALHDGSEANQHDQELEQIRQPSIAHKPVDDPEKDGADDANDEDIDQNQQHKNDLAGGASRQAISTLARFARPRNRTASFAVKCQTRSCRGPRAPNIRENEGDDCSTLSTPRAWPGNLNLAKIFIRTFFAE